MKNYKLNDFCFIDKINFHEQTKNIILDSIENFVKDNRVEGHDGQFISNTDWNIDSSVQRKWFDIFMSYNKEQVFEMYANIFKDFKIENFHITNWWFQQYENNSSHGWHNHGGCNFSNVYYLELPEDSSPTEFYNFDGGTEFANVKEGDLIIFPAHIPHRAANNSEKRRSVLVFNSNVQIVE